MNKKNIETDSLHSIYEMVKKISNGSGCECLVDGRGNFIRYCGQHNVRSGTHGRHAQLSRG